MTAAVEAVDRAAERLGCCGPACVIETMTVAVEAGVRTITVYCAAHGLRAVSLPTRLSS